MKPLVTGVKKVPENKKLIVFDLDGTLTKSKMNMDKEMAILVRKLLWNKKIAVIGGGRYQQFQKQFLRKLNAPKELLSNLFLFPTTSTTFYRYDGKKWRRVYRFNLPARQIKKIYGAFKKTFADLNYLSPKRIYGELIENRGTQVTLSFLGQKAPISIKDEWSKKHSGFKLKVAKAVQKYLPGLEVRAAGYTSIDITRKGIDKEYGLKQIKKYLGVSFPDMLFVGDALFRGGNDEAARRTGVLCFSVKNPEETKKLIRHLLAV